MVRGASIVLGAGLIALWLVGLGNHATAWLTWLDGVAALCAFGLAAAIIPDRTRVAVSQLARTRNLSDYAWLEAYRPLERVGKTIDLYYLP